MEYSAFFEKATGGAQPFPYQERLAKAATLPNLLNIPTGAGKTAAVALAWLWRRRYAAQAIRDATPRRLVYCLPMRVLVEQTAEECQRWLANLSLAQDDSTGVAVHILMGGEQDNDWDLYPERDAILIGTQDMLLSRALNRGYGASRYRWPAQFALLHADSLWVFDETQLFGVGLKTSAQLEAFRRIFNTTFPCHSLWMSATLMEEALSTVDAHEQFPGPLPQLQLEEEDEKNLTLRQRLNAPKTLVKASPTLTSDTKKSYAKELAQYIWDTHHARSGQTLVVLNTVGRAQDVYGEIQKRNITEHPVLLLHSRFRLHERIQIAQQLKDMPQDGRIIIATQAIEAGVNITSKTLITELAPWASLVQRFGRCNRYGEWDAQAPAEIHWIDLQLADKETLPYSIEQLDKARALLAPLQDAGLNSVQGVADGLPEPLMHVIRRKDMVELFDTTPDLAGADIDISRFIRDTDNLDVQLYWRELEDAPGPDEPKPGREELCSVRVNTLRDFFRKRSKDKNYFWVWDAFDGRWVRLQEEGIRPGRLVLVNAKAGGYTVNMGWKANADAPVPCVSASGDIPEEANTDDPYTHIGRFISLAEHSDHVVTEMEAILEGLTIETGEGDALRHAARRHDWGKAHPIFQSILTTRQEGDPPVPEGGPWAKSDRMRHIKNHPRPQFRHELAGALAALQTGQSDLVCYLIAAHHGKVRLSIRSMPEERAPHEPGVRFARGVWEGDILPACDLGGTDNQPQAVTLDLEPMKLGRNAYGNPSWLERSLALREQWGPFRLAYLETLIRAADCRASKKERQS